MKKVLCTTAFTATIILFGFGASAYEACETDFNRDGVTNDADFEFLKSYLGATQEDDLFDSVVDLDSDGEIGTGDLVLFLSCIR